MLQNFQFKPVNNRLKFNRCSMGHSVYTGVYSRTHARTHTYTHTYTHTHYTWTSI